VMDRYPTSRMTRLTTTARTGCLMKMSGKGTHRSSRVPLFVAVLTQLHVRVEAESAAGAATSTPSRSLKDPELPPLHIRLEAGDDQDFVARRCAGYYRALVGPRLSRRIRGNHEHVIAAGSLAQGTDRDAHGCRRTHRNLDSYRGTGAGAREVSFARTSALPGRGIDSRVNRGDPRG
jgi:hypothetical protein